MPFVEVSSDSAIYFQHHAPKGVQPTFVFVNSNGATTEVWEALICPRLRDMGFGTLTLDYRGQGQTRYGSTATLLPDQIVSDIRKVLTHVAPARPILVGLSIGGLYAMQSYLQGVPAEAIVLINTLRKPGALVEWVAELEGRLLLLGGMDLVKDCFRPLLCSPKDLAILRPDRLKSTPYVPYTHDNPRHRLGTGVKQANWDVPYEKLNVPVLVLTGLHDRLFRVQQHVDELVARIPHPKVVTFPDSGHALHEEQPEEFIAAIASFAAQLSPVQAEAALAS